MARISFEKAPTLHDVAKAAGVSKGTASNVFNRPDIVREEVAEEVADAEACGLPPEGHRVTTVAITASPATAAPTPREGS